MNPIFKTALFTTMVSGVLASCDTSKDEDLIEEPEFQSITITIGQANDIWDVRGEETETPYVLPEGPVHYYLYDVDHQIFVADKIATDSANNYSVRFEVIKGGNYVTYALSGVNYTIPYTDVSLTDYFNFNPEEVKSDVCLGSHAFTVTGDNNNISYTICVDHMFAQVDLSVKDVPSNVMAATAIITGVYDGFDWNGQLNLADATNLGTSTFTLTPSDSDSNTWESGYQYTYPSIDSSYNISVTFYYDDNTTSTYYGTPQTDIVAGHKLTLNGTIRKNMPRIRF